VSWHQIAGLITTIFSLPLTKRLRRIFENMSIAAPQIVWIRCK